MNTSLRAASLTLRELLSANGDKMGHTSHLSETDRSALEAFLETL